MKRLQSNASDSFIGNNEKNNRSSFFYLKEKFSDYSDSDLWLAFKSEAKDAFSYIYVSYYPTLYNYGYQFCQDLQLLQDCIQEVFIDIYKSAARLGNVKSIKFYLMKSSKTKYLRGIKSSNRIKITEEMG